MLEENWEDAPQWRIGIELRATQHWDFRIGYLEDETPQPPDAMSPLLGDADRVAYMGGLSYHTNRFRFDIAYEQVETDPALFRGPEPRQFQRYVRIHLSTAPHEHHPQVLKRRTPMKKTIFALSLVALLAAAPATAQVDLTNYVALGDSMSAGFASASMMDWYQDRSLPGGPGAASRRRDLSSSPYISTPGIGPIFELVSLVPTTRDPAGRSRPRHALQLRVSAPVQQSRHSDRHTLGHALPDW